MYADCSPLQGGQTVRGTVERVSAWSREETKVIVRSPPSGAMPDGINELPATCRVYRFGDDTKAGADFAMTLYRASMPYIEGKDILQARAVGNQFGGKQLRVHIKNFPRVQVNHCLLICRYIWVNSSCMHLLLLTFV